MTSGIYKITCNANNKFYIGSAHNLSKREVEHFGQMKRGNHSNSHLQNAYNKYGKDCFTFNILEKCEPEDCFTVEQGYFDKYIEAGEWDRLFNIKKNAEGGRNNLLTNEQAESIRNRYAEDVPLTTYQLADEYGVAAITVQAIVKGDTYREAGGPITSKAGRLNSLTHQEVLEIRKYFFNNPDTTYTEMAQHYEVSVQTITRAVTGESYKDVSGPLSPPKCKMLSEQDVLEIRNLAFSGQFTNKEIGAEYETSRSNIPHIVNGRTWKKSPGPIKEKDYKFIKGVRHCG